MVVRPYKITFIPALFIMLFGTLFLIFITYMPLNYIYELIVPPKETKKMDTNLTPEEAQAPELRRQRSYRPVVQTATAHSH